MLAYERKGNKGGNGMNASAGTSPRASQIRDMKPCLKSLLPSVLLALSLKAALAQGHHRPHAAKYAHHHVSSGSTASFYGWRQRGRRMANGRRFEPLGLTAASRTLPLGTRVRVTNLANHRTAVVLVTDHFHRRGRAIDLSLGAARRLGLQKQGLARVRIEPVAL